MRTILFTTIPRNQSATSNRHAPLRNLVRGGHAPLSVPPIEVVLQDYGRSSCIENRLPFPPVPFTDRQSALGFTTAQPFVFGLDRNIQAQPQRLDERLDRNG